MNSRSKSVKIHISDTKSVRISCQNYMKQLVLVLSILILSGCPATNRPQINPDKFLFAGITYFIKKERNTSDSDIKIQSVRGDEFILKSAPSDSRHLTPCPPAFIFVHDMNHDGTKDLNFYTCGFLDIYLDTGRSLIVTKPLEGKRKEGQWLWFEEYQLPGLTEKVVERLIRDRDPDL